jgi:hypothetical protein
MASNTEFSNPIFILFDLNNSEAHDLLRAFRAAFGKQYAKTTFLRSPRYCILILYPGGALERTT